MTPATLPWGDWSDGEVDTAVDALDAIRDRVDDGLARAHRVLGILRHLASDPWAGLAATEPGLDPWTTIAVRHAAHVLIPRPDNT